MNYIWTNGADYCVAATSGEALNHWCEHTGESAEDYRAQDWIQLPEEKELAFWLGDDT